MSFKLLVLMFSHRFIITFIIPFIFAHPTNSNELHKYLSIFFVFVFHNIEPFVITLIFEANETRKKHLAWHCWFGQVQQWMMRYTLLLKSILSCVSFVVYRITRTNCHSKCEARTALCSAVFNAACISFHSLDYLLLFVFSFVVWLLSVSSFIGFSVILCSSSLSYVWISYC